VPTSSFRLQFPAKGVGLLTAAPSQLTTQIDQVAGQEAATLAAVFADGSTQKEAHKILTV